MSLNVYIVGAQEAALTMSQIEPFWGSTLDSCMFMNRAFHFYFTARTRINRAPLPYSRKMQDSLDALASSGWSDLIDAFRHLSDTGGIWRDTSASDYIPRGDTSFFPHSVRSATSVVNFVNAVDAHFAEFQREVLDRSTQLNNRLEDATRQQQWDAAVEILDQLRSMAMEAIPEIWPDWTLQVRVGSLTGSARAETALPIAGYLESFKGALDAYSEASNRGLSEDHARALAALRMAVSFIPGLGGMYGTVIDMVPRMAVAVNRYANRANVIYESVAARTQRGLLAPEVRGAGGG